MPERAAATRTSTYLLMKGGVLAGRGIEQALAAVDLTTRQFLLLSVVAEERSGSQLEVSRQLHLDPTIVVSLVDELEQRGLLERRKHPEDRRRYVLSLTPSGTVVLTDAIARTAELERSFLEPLSKADRAVLHRLLERVVGPKLDQL